MSPSFTIVQVPCLGDNYGYLVHDPVSGDTAAIDTPDADAYRQVLKQRGWKLTHIFNTHHHSDHTGGNLELKEEGGVEIYGPAKENIPGIDQKLSHGDEVEFGKQKGQIIGVGGHTKDHIAYYFPSESSAFTGDALFALGCGRMFEGSPPQFWKSLERLRNLPDDTKVYCAHEYTEANAKFAVSVEPSNDKLQQRYQHILKQRKAGEPTVPSNLGEEKLTNPFLRCDVSDEIRKNVGVTSDDTPADAFAKVRMAKDNF
eukprot:CAMPEP_0178915034 /NCGR_PEP_ID=MMETSP0786-20121207/11781_1 /TAXON_ID=186022 /ORGANISM="Thalassionema frauenfeldii, Strain CCMP 1798" /LENGTH=257 /DNA_ID=CAMNT_0020588057 /DNA_START=182 /DNA_END=955 /DNA_ORIENTATION=-